jgi:hypothetical protein
MTFQNKVDVAKLLEMPGKYGKKCYKKICSQLRLQQLLECVCNNLHAGSNESLQIPDISKDIPYMTAENMINMGIMLVESLEGHFQGGGRQNHPEKGKEKRSHLDVPKTR